MSVYSFATLTAIGMTVASALPASADENAKVLNVHANYQLSAECKDNIRGVKLTQIAEASSVGSDWAVALIPCAQAKPLEDCQTKYGAFTLSIGSGYYSLPIVTNFTCQKK